MKPACVLAVKPELNLAAEAIPHAAMYAVVVAGSVSDALAQLAQHDRAKVVLAAVENGEGIELLQRMIPHYPDARFFVFTTKGRADDTEKARKLGAAGFVQQPSSPRKACGVVARALAGNRAT